MKSVKCAIFFMDTSQARCRTTAATASASSSVTWSSFAHLPGKATVASDNLGLFIPVISIRITHLFMLQTTFRQSFFAPAGGRLQFHLIVAGHIHSRTLTSCPRRVRSPCRPSAQLSRSRATNMIPPEGNYKWAGASLSH